MRNTMVAETNPYQASPESERRVLSFRTSVIAGVVGLVVMLGASLTLGIFLFALLVLTAGRRLPSPIDTAALLETSSQKLLLAFGGIFIAMFSFALATYVVSRILKSQRLAAEVRWRRQELQANIADMQAAVLEQKTSNGK